MRSTLKRSPLDNSRKPGFWASSMRPSALPWPISRVTPLVRNHCPAFVIPIGTGSKRDLSINSKMFRAELTETPCSTERPPKRMATFFFLDIGILSHQRYQKLDGDFSTPSPCGCETFRLFVPVESTRRE